MSGDGGSQRNKRTDESSSSDAPEATERYRDLIQEANQRAEARAAAVRRDRDATQEVERIEARDRRPLDLLDPVLAKELLLAESARAILEDEITITLTDDELITYEPAEPDRPVLDLVGGSDSELRASADAAAAAATAAQLRALIIGLQRQMDFEYDYNVAGDPVPVRTTMLRGAIAAAITRVGGLPGTPTVGSYVLALRRSRSAVTEPVVEHWLEHELDDEDLRVLLPPHDAPSRQAAAEAVVILAASGALTGRSDFHEILAVEQAVATLNEARADAGLEPVRLVDLVRSRRERAATRNGLGLEFERDLEIRPRGG